MASSFCPGSIGLNGTPTLKEKTCPECGTRAEVFSNDFSIECRQCGFTIYNDILSCVKWCKAAKECVGEEIYELLMARERERELLEQQEMEAAALAQA